MNVCLYIMVNLYFNSNDFFLFFNINSLGKWLISIFKFKKLIIGSFLVKKERYVIIRKVDGMVGIVEVRILIVKRFICYL